ncbi:hypothetical protein E4J89_14830 [Arthrobacter sp. CAU 1506]|nr:hypothetical protein E4J89_14830 [Arthrobacter sp. CAU 1506]
MIPLVMIHSPVRKESLPDPVRFTSPPAPDTPTPPPPTKTGPSPTPQPTTNPTPPTPEQPPQQPPRTETTTNHRTKRRHSDVAWRYLLCAGRLSLSRELPTAAIPMARLAHRGGVYLGGVAH